ncbi:MAG: hypothetical protein P4L50_00645, partial [Anaerolineaceae bacterium]|nr:hypothetical protein [Anaerolineaceae bacterium]
SFESRLSCFAHGKHDMSAASLVEGMSAISLTEDKPASDSMMETIVEEPSSPSTNSLQLHDAITSSVSIPSSSSSSSYTPAEKSEIARISKELHLFRLPRSDADLTACVKQLKKLVLRLVALSAPVDITSLTEVWGADNNKKLKFYEKRGQNRSDILDCIYSIKTTLREWLRKQRECRTYEGRHFDVRMLEGCFERLHLCLGFARQRHRWSN